MNEASISCLGLKVKGKPETKEEEKVKMQVNPFSIHTYPQPCQMLGRTKTSQLTGKSKEMIETLPNCSPGELGDRLGEGELRIR